MTLQLATLFLAYFDIGIAPCPFALSQFFNGAGSIYLG